MRLPVDESLRQEDFEDEFDALPEVPIDAASALDRARRYRRTRWQRRAAIGGCVVAVLIMVAVAVWPAGAPRTAQPAAPQTPTSQPNSPPPKHSHPTPTTSSSAGSCAGSIRIAGQGTDAVVVTRTSVPTIRLRVGDTVRLHATGHCAAAVQLLYRSTEVLRSVDDHTAKATTIGETLLTVGHAMCAELSPTERGCIGGLIIDGRVRVVVRAHR